MSVPVINGMPDAFESGDTVVFTEGFGDFPPASWSATVYLSLNGTAAINATATESGSTYTFTLTAANTATLAPGSYDFAIYCLETATNQRKFAKGGTVQVLPNLAASQTASDAAQQLSAANTTLTTLLAKKNGSVSFNGQSFTMQNIDSLYRIIARLEAKVKAERDERAALRGEAPTRAIRPYFQ